MLTSTSLTLSCSQEVIRPQVSEAANRFQPATRWDDRSIVWVDDRCRKKPHAAIVGTTTYGKQVAIFNHGLSHPPELLELTNTLGAAKPIRVKVISGRELARVAKLAARVVPDGLGAWGPCEALRLDDGEVDAVYIYWNHTSQRLDYWQN